MEAGRHQASPIFSLLLFPTKRARSTAKPQRSRSQITRALEYCKSLRPMLCHTKVGECPTLSHHLEKLKNERLIKVRRESTFLWYTANNEALEELLGFLYAECCTRNKAVKPESVLTCCK